MYGVQNSAFCAPMTERQVISMYGNNFVAFLTAFDDNGNVKLSSCEQMVQFYLDQHADGFYLHGFTGEGWCMTPEMRKQWMKKTVEVVDHRRPVFVSIGYGTEEEGIELARYAGSIGADAVSSVALNKEASIDENVAYFKKISEAAGIPFYVYWHMANGNLNGGNRIDAEELLDALSTIPTFAGFKYTDSNFYYAQRIKQYMPQIKLYTGVDQMCLAGHLMGSDGSIGALQAVTCEHYHRMLTHLNEGRLDEAFRMQLHANNIYAALDDPEVGGLIPGIKYIMKEFYKVDVGNLSPLSPNRELTDPAAAKRLMERFEANIYQC